MVTLIFVTTLTLVMVISIIDSRSDGYPNHCHHSDTNIVISILGSYLHDYPHCYHHSHTLRWSTPLYIIRLVTAGRYQPVKGQQDLV